MSVRPDGSRAWLHQYRLYLALGTPLCALGKNRLQVNRDKGVGVIGTEPEAERELPGLVQVAKAVHLYYGNAGELPVFKCISNLSMYD